MFFTFIFHTAREVVAHPQLLFFSFIFFTSPQGLGNGDNLKGWCHDKVLFRATNRKSLPILNVSHHPWHQYSLFTRQNQIGVGDEEGFTCYVMKNLDEVDMSPDEDGVEDLIEGCFGFKKQKNKAEIIFESFGIHK